MDAQLSLNFDSNGVRRSKAARLAGPFPIEPDGVTVRWPVVSRSAPDGIDWTLVDADDYHLAASRRWHVETAGYVVARANSRRVALHALVLPARDGLLIDHREGNKLDNRRGSLRLVTVSENAANLRLNRAGRSSRYRGVTYHKATGKWQAAAHHDGRCKHAGLHRREEDAALAFDRLAARLWPGIVPPNIPTTQPEDTMQRVIRFTLEKTTRGAVRYAELNDRGERVDQAESVIGTVYLRKSALAGDEPKEITITVNTQAA